MLHHISFSVSDIQKSSRFYDATLKPLGYRRVCEGTGFVGYGIEDNKDKFALKQRVEKVSPPSPGFHLAFTANSQQAVDSFYLAAMENGAKDNGKPGFREHYGPGYYAAFVIDLDGYELEAVFKDK